MKIGEALSLIAKFVVFTDYNHNILNYNGHSPLISRDFREITFRRISHDTFNLIFDHHHIDFYITNKDGFTHVEEMMVENIINAINRFNAILTFTELALVLRNVQIDTLLMAIGWEANGQFTGALDAPARRLLLNHLLLMDAWALQTYEKEKFDFTLGMDIHSLESSDINIASLYKDPMLKVLSSGRDTIIVCNKRGDVLRHERLPPLRRGYKPLEFARIVQWSKAGVAITLTSVGEILVFFNQAFIYLKRMDKWYPATTSPLYQKMDEMSGYNRQMLEALVNSCYDVSFKRCGACIGIVDADCPLIYESDRYVTATTPRAAFFRQILGDRKFQDIEREIRQELLAIDGAMVMDKGGKILAVGAILKINSSHLPKRATGGRSAAARQLAEYGIGIKISADGGIEAWKKNECGDPEKFIEVL